MSTETATRIPYRQVPSTSADVPAKLPMIEVRLDAHTTCTDHHGDTQGRMCLCHWAPWFDGNGEPCNGPNDEYEPPRGDPLAGLPTAEPWNPRR